MIAMLVLSLAPYAGPVRAGSVPGTTAFGLSISGRPGAVVDVRATGVPKGYIASFCTNRICAPFHISIALPNSGRKALELELIENEAGSREPRTVRVAAGGSWATIAFSRGTH